MADLHCYKVQLPHRPCRLFFFRGTLEEAVRWAENNARHARVCACCDLRLEMMERMMIHHTAQEQLLEAQSAQQKEGRG